MSSIGSAAEVRLSIPADSAYIAVPRSVVGNLAARNDFTVDAIDDLRIAVDEACSLLLPQATDGVLECVFAISVSPSGPQLTVRTSAAVPAGWMPDTDSFGWTVLTALVESAGAETVDGRLTITVTATAGATEKA
ncbi:anti-sigma regulatory factor [Kribbella italica]|uniref:Serine/threonine-protein kinase RsbW n=1 Tax=Kribbella italica TaxID=1540520 RepID=A0A7W9J7Z7_9ACTN|nr:anti-sigma regulatory factor [Kribbella italica]MBB5837009.1 serine/threonine-protein kinase RsbW [Kribbella italica]